MKKISIIIPIYFNEENIPVTYRALLAEVSKFKEKYNYEFIFVDDGSQDKSFEELCKIHRQNPDCIKIVKLTRNFGQVSAIQAGFKFASGEAIIVISADLQDPPELIHKFIYEWNQGYSIVLAARVGRKDDLLSKLYSKIFYTLMKKYSLSALPTGGFDYFLISRKVRNLILSMREKNSFIQGQILWTGFPTKIIPYQRLERKIGRSRWTTGKKIKYFIDGFVTFSYFPIRFISCFGISVSLLGFLYAGLILILKIIKKIPVEGWTPLMVVILIIGGIQMLSLGIIGEYLWRAYEETRKRPSFIVEKVIEEKESI
jgi:dolichol-phosphate mannosyltransferase